VVTLLWILGVVLLLAVAGVAWERYATRRDRRRFPPPGDLVDAGGYRLHLLDRGPQGSGPTIVLEAGTFMPSCHLERVRSRLSESARVVAYDRPGLGWSDPLPRGETHDARTIARGLRSALAAADIPGPYVLLGLSQGALHVIVFADRYQEDVAGVVLAEPQHPDAFFRLPNGRRMQFARSASARAGPALARLGVMHLLARPLIRDADGLPERERAELRAFLAQVRHVTASSQEVEAMLQFTFPQVRRARDFGDRPLIVLSSERSSIGGDRIHEEMAMLSSNSRHVIVQGASHRTLVTDQASARVVVDATRLVYDAVTRGRTLDATSFSG
jgi:pimeloyl-ACP methyl ester carboxylesterase